MSGRGWLDERAAQRALEAFGNQDSADRVRVAEVAAQLAAADEGRDGRDVETRVAGRGWSM